MPKNVDVSSAEMDLIMSACQISTLPTAKRFLGESPDDRGWFLFELVPHPECLTHMKVDVQTCRNMITTWDRQSNYCQHFSGGNSEQLVVPAGVMKTVVAYFCGPRLK